MDQRGSGRHRHPRTSGGGPPASWPAGRSSGGHNSLALKCIKLILAPLERGGGDLSIGTLVLKLYYILMRSNELRTLRRLPAASMLPAGSRRAPPERVVSPLV